LRYSQKSRGAAGNPRTSSASFTREPDARRKLGQCEQPDFGAPAGYRYRRCRAKRTSGRSGKLDQLTRAGVISAATDTRSPIAGAAFISPERTPPSPIGGELDGALVTA